MQDLGVIGNAIIIIGILAFIIILKIYTKLKKPVSIEPDYIAIENRYPKAQNVYDNASLNHFIKSVLHHHKTPEKLAKNQHFYITFNTQEVSNLPKRIKRKYKTETVIVLDDDYEIVSIRENEFTVKLSFNDKKHNIDIPYSSIRIFADPTIGFALERNLYETLG